MHLLGTSRAITAVAALLFSIGFVALEGSAHAATYQCGARGNYFDGFIHNNAYPDRFEGASTFLVTRVGGLCGTDRGQISNFTNAWSMIAGSQSHGVCEWAQSGFERGYISGGGTNIRHFAQASSCSTGLQTWYSGYVAAGVKHAYRSLWSNACSCINISVDDSTKVSTNFNPFAIWGYPFQPQFLGETSYLQNDMPGTPTLHTPFTALGAQRVSDDVLALMPCTMSGINDNTSSWAKDPSGCTVFDIWTK